jgi:hypothetical protein
MGGQAESKEQGGQPLRPPTAPVFPAAARLPLVGLGTWTQRKPGEERDAVESAIRWAGGAADAILSWGLGGAQRLSGGFRPAARASNLDASLPRSHFAVRACLQLRGDETG